MLLVTFILFFGVYISNVWSSDLYFPLGDVVLTIQVPKLKHNDRFVNEPLVIFNALPVTTATSPVDSNITYFFTGSKYLQLNSANGSLTFSPLFYEHLQQNGRVDIAGSVNASDMSTSPLNRTSVTTRVQIMAKVQDQPADCDFILKEICFWNSVTYQLYENRPSMEIGPLRSQILERLCPDHHVSYKLINGTEELFLQDSGHQWSLYSAKSFDRDIERDFSPKSHKITGDGSVLYFAVQCIITSSSGTKKDMEQVLRLNILDENDNLPKSQYSEQILDVHLYEDDTDNSLQAKLDAVNNKYLVFVDKDSKSVNDHEVKLLHDHLRLFRVSSNTYVDDRHGEHQTVIHFYISAVKNARSKLPAKYTIMLHINDNTLLPDYGDSMTNLTIRFISNSISKPLTLLTEASNLRRNILYPESVTIFRTAAPLARVSQASEKLVDTAKKFRLIQDSSENYTGVKAFNVTVKEGIIYVQNITTLRIAFNPVTLEIQWTNLTTKETFTDLLHIHLEMESSTTCQNLSNSFKEWNHCANTDSKKYCEDMCGLGTGGQSSVMRHKEGSLQNRCIWRGNRKTSSSMPMKSVYSTCTPDTSTCPDLKCDALEELHPRICPQDCASNILWHGERNNKTGRGIIRGRGTCKCDSVSTCYCGASSDASPKKISMTTNIITSTIPTSLVIENELPYLIATNMSRHTADGRSNVAMLSCGTPCVIGITAGAIFLLTALAAVVACWRMSPGSKDPRKERKHRNFVINVSDYYFNQPGENPAPSAEGAVLNFDMNASMNTGYVAPMNTLVDAKWEFPREKLRIEQTLGEGEFGRVLRAKALEIAGSSGYTTVAVKTLKEDARDTELNDLISEYQLLKEVSHPNVIRLLGASTLPGGPFYLIIEFAEHGSLRTYLRRSRHLESEGRTPNSSRALMPKIENDQSSVLQPTFKITPRDILSFAWQISRGMTYLSDMKLVHRDLAARNVLLAEGMLCKISDFGLTRDVYEDETYLKRTKGRVPVKWMAPESLADHIYNSKSDVWSFGILLWELVTLGASPYPGVAVQNLFHLLKSGYRMEKPENCSPVLYKIMRNCWNYESGERSSFRNLTIKFESMLADGTDYLDLNPNVVHNRTYFTNISDADVPSINEETESTPGYGNLTLIQPDTVLWKRPESPIATNRSYENEEKTQELNYYESPIKLKKPVLQSPIKERPQSYIDMAGATNIEIRSLLKSKSACINSNSDDYEKVSKVTSL